MARRLVLLLLVSAATVAGAQTRKPVEELLVTSSAPGRRGGSLYLATVGTPTTLNAAMANDTASTRLIAALYAPLVGYDAVAQQTTDGLAKSYTVSDDGLVWTFHLRKGVRWSDGVPFDADDVVFSFGIVFDPNVPTSLHSTFEQSDGTFPKIEKLDAHTVRLTFTEVNALTLENFGSVYLLPRHKLSKAYDDGGFVTTLGVETDPKDVVGLGPFRVKEVVLSGIDDRVVVERNPYYWKQDRRGQRLPYLDEVVFRVVPDMNAALLAFQSGESDMHVLRPEEYKLLGRDEATGGYKTHNLGAGLNVTYLLFNRNDPKSSETGDLDPLQVAERRWFSNVKFRQAISHAIDRARIVKEVYYGKAEPVSTFVTPGNALWYDPSAAVRYPRDLKRAKQLLAEIDILDRDGDGRLEDVEGNPIEFTIRTNSNNPSRVMTVALIAEDLKKLGITARVEPVPFGTMVEMLQDSHDFDAVVGGWQSGNPPDPILMKQIILSSGRLHYGRPLQPEPATEWERKIDGLMYQNQRTRDLTRRQRQFSEIQRLWSENLPEIDLVATH
jgi:peptide/nickel transport system substrate-binding protein